MYLLKHNYKPQIYFMKLLPRLCCMSQLLETKTVKNLTIKCCQIQPVILTVKKQHVQDFQNHRKLKTTTSGENVRITGHFLL